MTDRNSLQKLQETFFGKEALIIKARRLELLDNKIIELKDLQNCFISLNNASTSFDNPIQKLNVFSCLLYYKFVHNNQSKNYFDFVKNKLQPECEINQTNLFLICNIIEFEDRNKPSLHQDVLNASTKQFYDALLKNLTRFENKVGQYNILVSYYKALLHFMLQNVKNCEEQIKEVNKEIKKLERSNPLNSSSILEILTRLLIIRLCKLRNLIQNESLVNFEKEIISLMSDFEMKQPILAFKLGNYLVNFYIKKLDLEKCEALLKRLSFLITKHIKHRQNDKIARNLYITLLYKFIFCFSLQNNTSNYTTKAEELNDVIISEKQNHLKILYTFIYNTYMLDTDKNGLQKEKIEEQINTFKSCFINLNKSSTFAEFFLPNFHIIYNNLFAMNHDNPSSDKFKKIVSSYINKIQNGDKNILCGDNTNQHDIVNIYIYIYNLISYYINQYLSEKDETVKNKFKKQITNTIASLLSYINSFHKSMLTLKVPLVMNLVITLYAIYLDLIDNKSFDKVVEIYKKQFLVNLEVTSDYKGANGLIEKAIADNYFKQNKYEDALKHYKDSVMLFGNVEEEYRTGIVAFNMGICYLMLNNKKEAVTYLDKSLEVFMKLKDNLGSGVEVISKRCDMEFYEKKIKHVNDVLEMIQ